MPDALTPVGLVTQSALEIKADLDASFAAAYGASLLVNGEIPAATSIGQEIGILTDAKSTASEMLQAILAALDPDQAEDAALDLICAITGSRRKLASASTTWVTCIGTPGTLLPAGRVLTVQSIGTRFDSLSAATLALITATWAPATAYAVNAIVKANGIVWQCVAAGTSAVGGIGPSGVVYPSTITDGVAPTVVTWQAVCADSLGVGVALVQYQAEQTGPLGVADYALANIATPVDGWMSAFNALSTDAPVNGLGMNLEDNAPLRVRRVAELHAQGGGPADSIRAALLALAGVTACDVLVNNGDVVDANGLSPHSVEVLVLSTLTDAALATAINKAVGAGTGTSNSVGTAISASVTDASGNVQAVNFSRPIAVPIYVTGTIYYDPAQWPIQNAAAAVIAAAQSAIGTFAAGYYKTGNQVRISRLASAVADEPQATQTDNAGAVTPTIPAPAGSVAAPGIVDVALQVKVAGGAYGASVTLTAGQIATFDPVNMSTLVALAEAP